MKTRRISDSDLTVSEIGLGSWLTYAGGVSMDVSRACLRAAFDAGVTFFDTANVYGKGAAESVWGDLLANYPRESFVLATKLYFPMTEEDRGLSREQVHKQIDGSLRRLRTDYVDLYQCHDYDTEVPIEETLGALTEVVAAGKARYIGFSEWNPQQIRAGMSVPGAARFVSSQPQYSLLWREPEQVVFGECAEHGISQVVWSPLSEGVLTGKYRHGAPPPGDSRAASDTMGRVIAGRLTEAALTAAELLSGVASEAGMTTAQLALAWVLRRPEVSSAITGASRPEQVRENAKASGIVLDDAVLTEIDRVLELAGV